MPEIRLERAAAILESRRDDAARADRLAVEVAHLVDDREAIAALDVLVEVDVAGEHVGELHRDGVGQPRGIGGAEERRPDLAGRHLPAHVRRGGRGRRAERIAIARDGEQRAVVGEEAQAKERARLVGPHGDRLARTQLIEHRGCCNPYMNTVAQLVECFHIVETSIDLIDQLLTRGLKTEKVTSSPKAGKGAGCVEAPRGILFHEYEFDKNGKCVAADICIPTNQNHANIQKDFEKLLPEILDQSEKDIRLKLEMLVRAYDPCISCSTHFLDVQFVR